MIKVINEETIDSKDKFTLQVLHLPIHCYVDLQIELRKLVMASIFLSLDKAAFAIFGLYKQ